MLYCVILYCAILKKQWYSIDKIANMVTHFFIGVYFVNIAI